jgi:hypothetical protein
MYICPGLFRPSTSPIEEPRPAEMPLFIPISIDRPETGFMSGGFR